MKALLLLLALVLPTLAQAEDEGIAKIFQAHGVEGTMVLTALHGGQTFIHDEARAARRYPPASTFKILNTLIAAQEWAIADRETPFKWDGREREIPDWNRDQTLATAFKVSCVWCYQDIARKIGPATYRRYLRQADYGVLAEPFDLTTFWLTDQLQISAREQVAFLKKIVLRQLPFGPHAHQVLQDVMLAEQTEHYRLFAKTGWATRRQPQIGWYVGYVESRGEVWLFATNITLRSDKDLPLRQAITRAALTEKGVIR
ncbi:class D beta-lactamase [Zoogloea sp.]|uniref:class D beta-lactamase n=1 Tax=Zoogloea sp. TaxID=49181 RepID=UPI0035B147EB